MERLYCMNLFSMQPHHYNDEGSFFFKKIDSTHQFHSKKPSTFYSLEAVQFIRRHYLGN